MNVREIVFKLLDSLTGGQIIKDLRQIKQQIANNTIIDEKQLNCILNHAVSTVPAYRGYLAFKSLSDFPVVNKSILRDNIDCFISSNYDKSKLAAATTSGSTGTPFTIYYDARKIKRKKAALMYWNERANAPLGIRMFYMRVWNTINKKNPIRQFLENIYPIEVSNFGQIENDYFIQTIKSQRKPVAILGFSSAISELVKHFNQRPDNIKGIIAMSEHLSEDIRLKAQELFGCSVIARYSNMENGFIAQQFDNSGKYLVNTADFIIEILNMDNDEPVEDGVKGRIVITDLYNYAMPFIRYDTGDIGSLQTTPDGKRVLTSIEGRKSDVITNTIGEIMSPHVITNTMWSYTDVNQFQFIQVGKKEYKIRLNLGGKKFLKEAELTNKLRNYFGDDAEFSYEYVNEIPVLSSGKRRYIINEYLNH